MSLIEKINSLFSKKTKENQKAAEEAIATLRTRIDILNQKAQNLSESYPAERAKIQECFTQLNQIEPSASVRAGKFEQQIATSITKVSTACDKIFTNKDQDRLNTEINLLIRNIRERTNADNPVADEE